VLARTRIVGVAAAAAGLTALISACGYQPHDPRVARDIAPDNVTPVAASVTAPTTAPASASTAAPMPAISAAANVPVAAPNAQGDPACPASIAWGQEPDGHGVLVSYPTDQSDTVTVLVRTSAGMDRAQSAALHPGDLRLFEFADVSASTVDEVLVISTIRRCYATQDPATRGW
jgi:hypothetical protein